MNKNGSVNQRYIMIGSVISSFIITLWISIGTNNKFSLMIQSSLFVGMLLFVSLAVLIYKSLINLDFLKEWILIFPSIIFALSIETGIYFFDFKSSFLILCLNVLVLFFIILLILIQIYRFIDTINIKNYFKPKKHTFLLLWLFIFITWIPAFLAMYPGNLSYDGVPQLLQTIGHQGLSAHHPVLHTLYLTYSIKIGKSIFGSYDIGLAIYSLTQMLLLSSSLAYMVYKLIKERVNKIIVVLAIIFVSVNPLIQIWALTTTKDICFAALFIFAFILLTDLIMSPEKVLNSVKEIIKLYVTLVLMCLLRNQGIYVLIFSSIFIFVVISGRRYKFKFLSVMIGVIVSVKIILGPISTMAGVGPGDAREMYSVPMQQIARVYNMRKESISPQQLKTIENVIPEEYLKQYNPMVSDLVKTGFDTKHFNDNKMKFVKTWVELGVTNKRLYLESFLYGSIGYFYADENPYWLWYIMYDGAHAQYSPIKINRRPILKSYDKFLRNFSFNLSFQNIPVYNLAVSESLPFLSIIFCFGYALYQRKYKKIVALTLPFGFWGTLLLGPVIAVRYAFPIYVCVPFIIGIMFINKNSEEIN